MPSCENVGWSSNMCCKAMKVDCNSSIRCFKNLACYPNNKERPKRYGDHLWRQQLPVGDDTTDYSFQIIDHYISKTGEPRDWFFQDGADLKDNLDTTKDYLEECRDVIEKMNGTADAAQGRFLGVIGSYIDMLNQVGLFATLVIGFGMSPISTMISDPVAARFQDYLLEPFIWTSFLTIFASGWCVIECVFLAIGLNVVSSALLTGWGTGEQKNQRAVKLRQLTGINDTWNGIMLMFFISIGTFITQSIVQFVMGLHIKEWPTEPKGSLNSTEWTTVQTEYAEKSVWGSYHLPASNSTSELLDRNTATLSIFKGQWGGHITGLLIASITFSVLLLYRCSTKYVKYTSTTAFKVFSTTICFPLRCCLCYWPQSYKYDEPLLRLNYEYEFAVKNLQYIVEETQRDLRQLFQIVKTLLDEDPKLKYQLRLTITLIRNLELFILQNQEGRNRMQIREGIYSDLDSGGSLLDKMKKRRFGDLIILKNKLSKIASLSNNSKNNGQYQQMGTLDF